MRRWVVVDKPCSVLLIKRSQSSPEVDQATAATILKRRTNKLLLSILYFWKEKFRRYAEREQGMRHDLVVAVAVADHRKANLLEDEQFYESTKTRSSKTNYQKKDQ